MLKYNIYFGEDLKNNSDNKNNKTIGDIKDFIICFNDSLCTYMLKL
jgi:hypothetical protein